MKNIYILGTGVIGTPLIGLFLRHKNDWGIENVYFHKNTPLIHDANKIKQLINLGGIMVSDASKFDDFARLGTPCHLTQEQALEKADVVIDCTPVGNKNKELFYKKYDNGKRLFLAQGSEKGFGIPYARNINEKAVTSDHNFVQVVSCNTHNIAVLTKAVQQLGYVSEGDFVCIRRSNDISQNDDITPSIDVNKHGDALYGTHHAQDATNLLQTLVDAGEVPLYSPALFSSSCKINTQYMHSMRFRFRIQAPFNSRTGEEKLLNIFKDNKKIALTYETSANKIFSFGREYGYYGRILNQTVVSLPTLSVVQIPSLFNGLYVSGFCFTPQDSNSLLSSVAATLWHLSDRNWEAAEEKMKITDNYLFPEI